LLLDHEDLSAQAQNRVELLRAEFGVVFADPVDRHNADSLRKTCSEY
jgi:hypothetical protein